ncbi:MAG: HEPN domain-containing protein [Firmicutes bacterium]|nr:HEPN domain-containing protein [Bacillota bacterium]
MNQKVKDMLRSANEFLVISSNKKTYIPNFVNIAFACELYLKAILQYKTGSYPRGHDLEYLYNKAVIEIDEAEFLTLLARQIDNSFIDIGVSTNIDGAKRGLKTVFDRHKNLYKELRYVFEKPKNGILSISGTLRAFALALKNYTEYFSHTPALRATPL